MVLLVVLGRFGWFWVVLGGFGWFWVVPCFSNYVKLRVLPKTKMTTFSLSVSLAPYAIPFVISLEI